MTQMIKGDRDLAKNPDRWLRIPDFGVIPIEVNFVGFRLPLIGGAGKDRLPVDNLVAIVRQVRNLARQQFQSINDLRIAFSEAMDAVDAIERIEATLDDGTDRTLMLTHSQETALLYELVIQDISAATGTSSRTPSVRFNQLASAASILTTWLADGSAASVARIREKNRKNASHPRPNARKVDHDEIRSEFNRLVREGHTDREARGLLVQRGKPSQTTIFNITKK